VARDKQPILVRTWHFLLLLVIGIAVAAAAVAVLMGDR